MQNEENLYKTTEKNPINFKIQKLRDYLGLSKTEFARKLNFSTAHVIKLEKGTVSYREDVLNKICDTFHVRREYFTDQFPVDSIDSVMIKDAEAFMDGLSVAERLKKLRERRNLTQAMLAEAAGTAQSLISSVESGNRKLLEKPAEKLAAALNVGTEFLLTGDTRKERYPVNKELTDWLWKNEEIRKNLWEQMNSDK